MTTEKQELLGKLSDLHALSKKRKMQLAKPEQHEAISVLSALCKLDSDSFNEVMSVLTEFPSDVGAEVLGRCWDELTQRKEPVYLTLKEARFSSDLGKRLRLVLALNLLSHNPSGALRVLIHLCQSMKPAMKPIPTSKDLRLINSAFLKGATENLSKLPLSDGHDSQIALLITYLLSAAFVAQSKGKSAASAETQLILLRWANSYTKLPDFPIELSEAIRARVRDWSGDFLTLLRTELNNLHTSLRDILEPLLTGDIEHEMAPTPQRPTVPSPDGARQPPSCTISGAREYNIQYEISRLVKYVEQLESLLLETQSDLTRAEQALISTRSKIEITQREKVEAQRLAAIERKRAEQLAGDKTDLLKAKALIGEALGEMKTRLDDANARHQEIVKSYELQLDALSERNAGEVAHRISAFRNSLATRLQPYAQSLKEAECMDMTPELGAALRTQLKQILLLLKKEGINVSGDT